MHEHMLLHTRQSSTRNNKYQVSPKHSCVSWWWAHSRPKRVEIDMLLHTRQSSTRNNKYQVSHEHSCFSWWLAHFRPKHVQIDKYSYKHAKKNCAPSWFVYQIIQRCTVNRTQNLTNTILYRCYIYCLTPPSGSSTSTFKEY